MFAYQSLDVRIHTMANHFISSANKQAGQQIGDRWQKIDGGLPWDQIRYSSETRTTDCTKCAAFKGRICWVRAVSAPEDQSCNVSNLEFLEWAHRERI